MPYWADGTVVLIFLLYTIRNCSVAINSGEIKLPHNDYTSMPIRGASETIFIKKKKGETWNSHVYVHLWYATVSNSYIAQQTVKVVSYLQYVCA